ncbi:MAG: glycosyltransferase, partial [Planctomycetota bacterium]
MRPIRSVSVLMPTFQGLEFQGRVFEALAGQELELPWDVHVVDSGSSDGTWECLGEWATRFPVPFSRQRIHPVEFDHGDTRNLLAAQSAGDLCVFLTQDAVPQASDWLARLVADFGDESVGAAYCRNVPRPDASPLTRILSAGDPGYATESGVTRLPDSETYAALPPQERRLLYNFNDVASAVRRELWERHPFPRTNFGEDVLMARALLEAGFAIVYDAQATVEHSHDYDARELYERAWIDGRFNAEWLDRVCVGSRSDVEVLVQRVLRGDATAIGRLACERSAEQQLLEEAERLRRATFLGLYQGGRSDRRRRATRLRANGSLRVLMVVHGFPPDTWAGTEVYTLNLARELVTRGHTVTILARSPARSPDEVDFDVVEEVFEGLRVLRLVHRLEHARLSESYSSLAAEEAFRGVLERERPDVVHFQHLIHTSAGLVHVARGLEIPTLITCHDYWALCARVQFIRPDGVICAHNMGSGCYLCVKEQGLSRIESAQRMDGRAGEVVQGYARDLARERGTSEASRRRAEEYLDLRAREEVVPAAYAACDLRISPSRFLRERYLESGHFDAETFLFSDNGMRTDHVQALTKVPDEQGRLRFGFVGSLVWYKGVEVLVRALQRLAGEPCVLNVYGDFRPQEDAHHLHLEQLARKANVHFRGRFDNARLSAVYAEIDVLVVPSVWLENSPITIHEAFLTRTPVLASGIGGMAEFVRDGVDGLHFAVGDDADLATKMRRLLTEDGLLERLQADFQPVKTIQENAAEMEFRYRGLCCRVPDRPTPDRPTPDRST